MVPNPSGKSGVDTDEVHPAALSEVDLLAECEVKRTRGSGPGGQHRNKVETAIVVTHRPTGIAGRASERRSQDANRKVAIHRLRIALALGVRVARAGVSAIWKSRTRQGKLAVNEQHIDFPNLLAESLDWIAQCEFDLVPASETLEVSRSQLVKFLKREPGALSWLNQNRESRGLHRLK